MPGEIPPYRLNKALDKDKPSPLAYVLAAITLVSVGAVIIYASWNLGVTAAFGADSINYWESIGLVGAYFLVKLMMTPYQAKG